MNFKHLNLNPNLILLKCLTPNLKTCVVFSLKLSHLLKISIHILEFKIQRKTNLFEVVIFKIYMSDVSISFFVPFQLQKKL